MPQLRIHEIEKNQGRTIFIGDVHGCAYELEELIQRISPSPSDRLISLGDLINRGPYNRETLEIAKKYKILPILGNHELRLLNAYESGNLSILKNSDISTFHELHIRDWNWIKTWPHVLLLPYAETIAVHGGFLPDIPWPQQPLHLITSIQVIDARGLPAKRSQCPGGKSWADFWKGPEFVVYGHTPREAPKRNRYTLGIDTGCVYGYHLSAFCLESDSFFSVQARKAYR